MLLYGATSRVAFSKGNIKETFGDVLAMLKREFSQSGLTNSSIIPTSTVRLATMLLPQQ